MSATNWQTAYVEQYEDYAHAKASYYSKLKFQPVTPWGWSNARREAVIVDSVSRLMMNATDGQVIADVGCASGHTTLALASANPRHTFVGLDVAKSFIDEANQSSRSAPPENVSFRTTRPDEVALPSEYAQGIVLAEVIEHVPDYSQLLAECARVLAPGAWLLVTTPYMNGDGTLWGRLGRLLGVREFAPANDFSVAGTQDHGDQHLHEFSPSTLASAVSRTGLQVLAVKTMSRIDGPGHSLYARAMVRWQRSLKAANAIEDTMDRFGSLVGGRQLFLVARK